MCAASQVTHRIFVSHSSKDHNFCIQLVEDLRHHLGDENSVWYDAGGGLHGGDSWFRKIVAELTTRDVFIVVLSPDAVESPWVNDEIDLAWRQKNSPARLRIIPLLHRPCQARFELYSLQMVSFLPPKPYKKAFNELLLALGLSTENVAKQGATQPGEAISTQKTKQQWVKEGNSHYAAKQYREALADYYRAIQLDPNYATAYNGRGNVRYSLEKYSKALADYDRAIELDRDFALAYFGRGNVYFVCKDYQRAEADYDRAIELDPNNAKAYNGRGNVYYNLNQHQKALADYDRAIELDPDYAKAYNGRGNVYFAREDYQRAIADYTLAVQLDSSITIAKNNRDNAYQRLQGM